jgi:cytochrome P450
MALEPPIAAACELSSLALSFIGDPRWRRDWRAFYDVVLGAPPIYLGGEQWLLSGRADVITAMRDEGASLTALYPVTCSPTLNELFLGLLPYESGATHRRLRSMTQSLFSADTMARLQNHVASLLDKLLFPALFEAGGCDVLEAIGIRAPEAVSCLLLDVAPSEWDAIGRWSRTMYKQIGCYDQPEVEIREAERALQEFSEYVRRRAHDETSHRYAGIGEALIRAWRDGRLDDNQLLSYFALFLFTGLDTLTYAIGNSSWFLGNHPDVFSAIRSDPKLAGPAFGEAMRLWGPIRLCVRQLQNPVPLGAGILPAGSTILLLIHAANRDPQFLESPDEVVWNRPGSDDLAFGVGLHGCLGMAVGKMVGTTLYRKLAERCRVLHATPGPDELSFIPSLPILGIQSVGLSGEPA